MVVAYPRHCLCGIREWFVAIEAYGRGTSWRKGALQTDRRAAIMNE
jgi:hypothetical protein